MPENEYLKVIILTHDHGGSCTGCHEPLHKGDWITKIGPHDFYCLTCSDLDHLVYLPSGNTALTARSRKRSTLNAVVMKWSQSRKHYERQGILVEEAALHEAEVACLGDEPLRVLRREREAIRRSQLDHEYITLFAQKIRDSFPGCPPKEENLIAEHACEKHSGRVGRTEAAKDLDETAVRLAVVAHIRHAHTNYDRLLAAGILSREDARLHVKPQIDSVLTAWKREPATK
jgi:hypothetical protein